MYFTVPYSQATATELLLNALPFSENTLLPLFFNICDNAFSSNIRTAVTARFIYEKPGSIYGL